MENSWRESHLIRMAELVHLLFVMFRGSSITFINFIWEWFSTNAHWIRCILWFCSQINHNSSKRGNSLLIMFCELCVIFIDFIWLWFSTETHWIRSIPWFGSQINHNSSRCWFYRWFRVFKYFTDFDLNWIRKFTFRCWFIIHSWFITFEIDSIFWLWQPCYDFFPYWNSLFIMFYELPITFINFIWVKLAFADRINILHRNMFSFRFACGECCVYCWGCISTLMWG
jgi:hypothetical protein